MIPGTPTVQLSEPPLNVAIAVTPRSHRLMELMQRVGDILNADTVDLSWRPDRMSAPCMFLAWNRALPAPRPEIEAISDGPRIFLHGLRRDRKHDWVLGIKRSDSSPRFSPAELTLSRQVAEIFEASFRLWRQSVRKNGQLGAFQSLVAHLDCGIALVTATARMVYANEKAYEILKQDNGVFLSGGHLTAHGFTNTLRLQAAFQYALQGRGPAGPDMSSVISIERVGKCPMPLATFAVEAQTRKLVAVYLVEPTTDLSAALDVTCRAHGLTPTEARLVRHLATGTQLNAACEMMRIKEQTGRTYLKQVFSKLGISRQVDLVRYVLANAIPLRFPVPITTKG